MTIRLTIRSVQKTVLLVGEGASEHAFLHHLKSLYALRGCGVAVSIKNAGGKGALHVVDVAKRHSRNAQYDAVAALLDTDTDWNEKTAAIAKKAKVRVVQSTPCLEAVLLQMHAQPVYGKTAPQLKRDFSSYFGGAANESKVYDQHFPAAFLNSAVSQNSVVSEIMRLLQRP